MIISREIEKDLLDALTHVPVVALLGPRQVGKTTVALEIAHQKLEKSSFYLDLELDQHQEICCSSHQKALRAESGTWN